MSFLEGAGLDNDLLSEFPRNNNSRPDDAPMATGASPISPALPCNGLSPTTFRAGSRSPSRHNSRWEPAETVQQRLLEDSAKTAIFNTDLPAVRGNMLSTDLFPSPISPTSPAPRYYCLPQQHQHVGYQGRHQPHPTLESLHHTSPLVPAEPALSSPPPPSPSPSSSSLSLLSSTAALAVALASPCSSLSSSAADSKSLYDRDTFPSTPPDTSPIFYSPLQHPLPFGCDATWSRSSLFQEIPGVQRTNTESNLDTSSDTYVSLADVSPSQRPQLENCESEEGSTIMDFNFSQYQGYPHYDGYVLATTATSDPGTAQGSSYGYMGYPAPQLELGNLQHMQYFAPPMPLRTGPTVVGSGHEEMMPQTSPKRKRSGSDDGEDEDEDHVTSEYLPNKKHLRTTTTASRRRRRRKQPPVLGVLQPASIGVSLGPDKLEIHHQTQTLQVQQPPFLQQQYQPHPPQRPTVRIPSAISGAHSKSQFRCSECPMNRFKDQVSLNNHVKKYHTRPFKCVFYFAGCGSTFANKNEWKRHVMSQHILPHYWLCKEGDCAYHLISQDLTSSNGLVISASSARGSTVGGALLHRRKPSVPPALTLAARNDLAGGGTSSINPTSPTTNPTHGVVFNRKDLYTQHLRRMHMPEQVKALRKPLAGKRSLAPSSAMPGTASSNNNDNYDDDDNTSSSVLPQWETHEHHLQANAIHNRCPMPEYMRCPLPDCNTEFCGERAWNQRMEHVAKHLEASITTTPKTGDGNHNHSNAESMTAATLTPMSAVKSPGKEIYGAGDPTLVAWASRADVAVIVPRIGSSGELKGWKLNKENVPAKKSSGGRQTRTIGAEDEEDEEEVEEEEEAEEGEKPQQEQEQEQEQGQRQELELELEPGLEQEDQGEGQRGIVALAMLTADVSDVDADGEYDVDGAF